MYAGNRKPCWIADITKSCDINKLRPQPFWRVKFILYHVCTDPKCYYYD